MATEDILIRYRADVSQLEADINKLIDAQEELLKETKAGNEEQKKVLTSAEFAAKKRLELLKLEEERLKKLQAAQKLAFDPKEIEKYNRQIDESNKKIQLLGGTLEKQKQGINNFGSFASNAFSNIGIAIAAAFSIDAISNFTRNAVQEFSKLETSRVTFEVLIGNAEKAKQIFDELRAFSLTTPFATEDVQAAAKSLVAFGIDANDVVEQIKILGDVSAGTGKNINELAIIFGQIQSTGRLTGQDLLQLINAGFNPLQIISEKTGKSIAVLKKELEKGAISSEMIADAFKTATSEGGLFFQLTDRLSKSTAGQLAELDDRTQQLSQTIGERLAPSYIAFRKALLDSATTIINFFDNLGKVINENQQSLKLLIPLLVTLIGSLTRATQIKFYESLVQSVQGLKDFVVNTRLAIVQSNLYTTATGRLSLAQKTAAIATTTFTKAQQALSAAIKANPIGLLLGALSTAYILYEQFSQAAQDAAKAQEQQAEAVKELDDISDSYNKKIAQEEKALNTLVDAIKKAGTGTKERKDLLDKLNNQYGTTLKNIKDEKEFLDALKESYDKILPSIRAKFLAQAGEERFTKALDQELDATLELERANKNAAQEIAKVRAEYEKNIAQAAAIDKAREKQGLAADRVAQAEQRLADEILEIQQKYQLNVLDSNKRAASQRVTQEENTFKRLKANAEFFGDDLVDIEKQTNSELSKEQKKAAEEREKQRQKEYQESVDNFLKLRDEADKLLKDLEFNITLNTKGLAPAIDQFQKTASEELENAINLLNLEIQSNPLAFDALTNEQKLALLQKNFTEFVNDIDQKWKDGGVSIAETSENIAAALGPEFLSLPFEEAIKKLPELAAKYLPIFKGQFKDTADEVKTQAEIIAEANEKAAEDYANSWLGRNEEVLKSFVDTFSALGDLFKSITDTRIQELERETNAELEALETRNKNNEEQLENRAISEREFLEQQTKIENEKIALQEEAAEREKELKRQQFAIQQATAIFEIALSTAIGVAEISRLAAVYQSNPKTAVLAVNANLQKILLIAQAAAQVAAVLAQPKPYRKGSKDTGPEGHLARVGEEGEEIVYMPGGSKVLPARQTNKYGDVLDAMFDNKLDSYILKKYVTPALMAQKQKYESEKGRSFADNLAKSIYFNGGLNANDMERIRKKGQPITNVEELADAIARRIPTRDIYR